MGSLRLTLCTGILAVAACTPSAHAAHAVDGGSVSVTPDSPAPGADVSLRVNGCSGPEGTAVSAAFVSDARLSGRQGTLSGETRVRSSLRPGAYDVRITCADFVINGRITIPDRGVDRGTGAGRGTDGGADRGSGWGADQGTGAGRGTDPGTGADRGTGQAENQQPMRPPGDAASPVAPVHAGGGGTATHFATVATSESGPGTAQTITGLGLAGIAALAVGLRAHRGRTSRNSRDSRNSG
ncbi:hypothetical protein ACH47Z_07975 [Streptomyces sp. NPDC020192]|uniref:hypothetical protein n=1 Tax=Streptomyces sp. NPDC020192 TaxID=3365066 RepID=UPI0037A5596E